jgi:luciferase family oxidoreductase group 1
MIPLSVLDPSPIVQGGNAAQALRSTLDLALHAERLGYRRFWLGEHHCLPGIASAATAVVMAFVAGGTATIRVGSGGVRLPDHPPLLIAEQFGTLEALHAGRIDLGVGPAVGADQRTTRAIHRGQPAENDISEALIELQGYFAPVAGQQVRAVPGAGLHVPIWVLASCLPSARLAARLGLPLAFAAHLVPHLLNPAVEAYRAEFNPSEEQREPRVMVVANVIAADSDARAARLFTSLQQQHLDHRRGRPGPLPPPIDHLEERYSAAERLAVDQTLACAMVGSPATVQDGLEALLERVRPDEIMVTAQIFDQQARMRSLAIVAEVGRKLRVPVASGR